MKTGVLKNGFTFKTVSGLRFTVPKGTVVVASDGKVYFVVNGDGKYTEQPIYAFKVGRDFFVSLYGAIHLLEKFNPHVPYPLSLL